jgi:hypothetical protein
MSRAKRDPRTAGGGVAADEPKVWFTSTESFAKVLSDGNRAGQGHAEVTYDRVALDLPLIRSRKAS